MQDALYIQPVNSVVLDVTKKCNLDCKYCFVSNRSLKSMSMETFAVFIDWFVNRASQNETEIQIAFFGGEPLMEKSTLRRMIRLSKATAAAAGKRLHLSVSTNGTLLDEDILHFFREHGVRLSISLDGAKETHDRKRKLPNSQDGSFSLIERWFDALLQSDGDIKINVTTNPDTVSSLHADVSYFLQEGFSKINVVPNAQAAWSEEQADTFRQQLEMIARDYIAGAKGKAKQFEFHLFEVIINKHLKSQVQVFPETSPVCGAGKNMVGISTDGGIYPCASFTSIKEQDYRLGDIYTGITNTRLLKMLSDHNSMKSPACSGCSLLPGGCGCYFVNVRMTGEMFAPHRTFCQLIKEAEKAAHIVYDALYEDIYKPIIGRNICSLKNKLDAEREEASV